MLDVIRAVYELYGFEALETPAIEYTDALGKFLPDQDRPNEGVFSLQDDDEQWLSLRYDLTAPLARYVAQNFDRLPKPYRRYRCGHVWRNEKPGPGRFRQFMQFDADTVGSASPAADAEICMMAADALERLGIARGDYVIKINNRKVLDGVMEAIGLAGDENAGRRLVVLRAIDKLDRLGPDGVRLLLGAGPQGRERRLHQGRRARRLTADRHDPVLQPRRRNISDGKPALAISSACSARARSARRAREELLEIEDLARDAGFGPDRIRIDPSVVRGLEYYTGPVFEAELTFETQRREGPAGALRLGRRRRALRRPRRALPTGEHAGDRLLDRRLAPLRGAEARRQPDRRRRAARGPVVVLVLDRDRIADYQRMVGAAARRPASPPRSISARRA